MHHRTFLPAILAAMAFMPAARAETPAQWAADNTSNLIEVYRWFHQHPELSNQEEQTAERLSELWKQAGVEVHTGIGGHGIVGVIKNGPGPTLMLRADMDALPVVENTGLVYASQVKVRSGDGRETGVMHACGHDIHITNLTGVVQFLTSHKSDWSGTIILVGQPAEERGAGAKQMLEDGLFTKFPKPDMALALHCDGALETGKVGYRAGFILANVDSVDITMHGRGGHGAAPHTVIDPIVQAAQLVVSLQTLVSRETDPVEPAVVTVGSIHGGTKHNIVPDNCHLQLTIRSYSSAVRERLLEGIRRKANAVADGAGAPKPTVETLNETTPALFNDEKLVERVVPTLRKALGDSNAVPSEPSMGGEDFSRYGQAGVPVFMFRLGTVEPKRLAGLKRVGEPPSLHSSAYYPDAEPALKTGITAMCAAVLDLLPPKMRSSNIAGRSRRTSNWVWFTAYLVAVGVVVLTMLESRRVTLREMDTPKALAHWQEWRESEPNRADSGPVQRRPPSSPEPPALVLLRDHFGVMMAGAVLFSSLVFAAITVAAHGAFSTSRHPVDSLALKTVEGEGQK